MEDAWRPGGSSRQGWGSMTGEAGATWAGPEAVGGGFLGGHWERAGQDLGQSHVQEQGPLMLFYQVWEGSRKKEVGNG